MSNYIGTSVFKKSELQDTIYGRKCNEGDITFCLEDSSTYIYTNGYWQLIGSWSNKNSSDKDKIDVIYETLKLKEFNCPNCGGHDNKIEDDSNDKAIKIKCKHCDTIFYCCLE